MKFLFAFFLILFCISAAGENCTDTVCPSKDTLPFINPTGTYHYGPFTPDSADEPLGNQGDIRIQYLGNNRIVLCLNYVSHGPGFSMGFISDTLYYADNWAEWRTEYDSTCIVRFAFSEKGINVRQYSAKPGFSCGFGHNVYVNGYYRKLSEAVPEITEDCT